MENKALGLVYLQLQGLSRFFPRVLFQSNLPFPTSVRMGRTWLPAVGIL